MAISKTKWFSNPTLLSFLNSIEIHFFSIFLFSIQIYIQIQV